MSYIDDLRNDYNIAIKQWRTRYKELDRDEYIEAIDITMKHGGKKEWDSEPDIYEKIIKSKIEQLNLDKGIQILDAGCGIGFFLCQLSLMGFKNLDGVDISQTCLEICKERAEKKSIDIKLYNSELKVTGYMKDSFDLIICTEVLEHDPEPLVIINELYRILKPKGYLFMSTPRCDHRTAWNHINYFIQDEAINHLALSEYTIYDINALLRKSNFQYFRIEVDRKNKFYIMECTK